MKYLDPDKELPGELSEKIGELQRSKDLKSLRETLDEWLEELPELKSRGRFCYEYGRVLYATASSPSERAIAAEWLDSSIQIAPSASALTMLTKYKADISDSAFTAFVEKYEHDIINVEGCETVINAVIMSSINLGKIKLAMKINDLAVAKIEIGDYIGNQQVIFINQINLEFRLNGIDRAFELYKDRVPEIDLVFRSHYHHSFIKIAVRQHNHAAIRRSILLMISDIKKLLNTESDSIMRKCNIELYFICLLKALIFIDRQILADIMYNIGFPIVNRVYNSISLDCVYSEVLERRGADDASEFLYSRIIANKDNGECYELVNCYLRILSTNNKGKLIEKFIATFDYSNLDKRGKRSIEESYITIACQFDYLHRLDCSEFDSRTEFLWKIMMLARMGFYDSIASFRDFFEKEMRSYRPAREMIAFSFVVTGRPDVAAELMSLDGFREKGHRFSFSTNWLHSIIYLKMKKYNLARVHINRISLENSYNYANAQLLALVIDIWKGSKALGDHPPRFRFPWIPYNLSPYRNYIGPKRVESVDESSLRVIQAMQDSGNERMFILGSFESTKAIFHQQSRSISLAYALHESGVLDKDVRACVVGGGFGGVTFAVAAARLGVDVTLFERADSLLPLQQGSERYVHPRSNLWPDPAWEDSETPLPFCRWEAGQVGKIASDVEASLQGDLSACSGSVEFHAGVTVERIDERPGKLGARVSLASGEHHEFDLVVVSVGFGAEHGAYGAVGVPSYWRTKNNLFNKGNKILVSGYGDGAYIDVIQGIMGTQDYIEIVNMFPKTPEVARYLAFVEDIEKNLALSSVEDLWDAYDKIGIPDEINEVLVNIDPLCDVTLCTGGDRVISRRSFPINRLLVFWAIKTGKIRLKKSRIEDDDLEMDDKKVYSKSLGEIFDVALIRHGGRTSPVDDLVLENSKKDLSGRISKLGLATSISEKHLKLFKAL